MPKPEVPPQSRLLCAGALLAAAVCLLLVVTAVRPAHAQGLPDPDEAKAANVCHKAIGKAGAAFASKKLKHLRKCIDAVFACVQLKGSSTDCLTHAETICDKEFDKILNKELPKLQGAIAKRCNEEKIPYDVLRMATGADLDALAAECVALDVVLPFNSLDKYVECVYRHHECNAEELLRFEAPRAEELLAMVNRPLKSDFCIPPTPTPTRTRTPTPTRTATPTRTLTPTPTVTPTVPPATSTAETPTPTLTPTGTATETPSPTPTATDTGPTPSPTVTSTPNPFNFTFVTSTVHQGNFGGLAGGDTICSQRATAAGLPGTYVAWLSTSSIDAASRLGSAQGWIAIDGTPFANTVADIVGNKIFNPLRLDENGVDIGTAATWTGTLKTGIESVGFTCNDWTEFMTGQGLTGNTQGGPASWTQDKNNNCVNARRLRCFRTDLAANLAPPPVSGKIAFATLVNFTPGGGRNAADAICTSEASANGLPGTYKALISTTTESAASRFTLAAAYRRPDGILIGSGAMLAAGGILKSGIWQTANGTYLNSASEAAWTGALTPNDVGTLASTCDDWSATTSTQGVFGFATYADATWWNFGTRNCNTGLHVYCVQE